MAQSSKTISQARVYINPGHGGWGSNDRPLATINYPVLDTLGFFETNTDLVKGFELRDQLQNVGAYVKMSRTMNGIVSGAPTNANEITAPPGQIVSLSEICADVDANNIDYFISIHSNAATDGSTTNFALLLYRGTDAASGNSLVDAKAMATQAWKYVNKNDVTYHSHYATDAQNNSRGDLSFYGGTPNPSDPVDGYLGVLRHRTDGYLSEGCFHTYHPERHRLLNKDYCRQEGIRYSRAIRAWFGDTSESKGSIMGTVKNKYESLTHALYKYQFGSNDAYSPMNEVTVALQTEDGTPIATYKTDKEYNGIYVFYNLAPGTYKLVYDIAGFWKETEEIEVVANETSFINKLLTDTGRPEPKPDGEDEPEVDYYPHPTQDGDIMPSDSYTFTKEVELDNVEALKDLTVRRAILRDGKYYVLAVKADKTPKLMVLNPETGDLIKEMSTTGISTEGYNGKSHMYNLSDIAFTNDGVLIGTNSTVVGKEANSFQTGNFYVYKWQAADGGLVEDATPATLLTLPTNTSESLAAAGNNNSNFVANTIAVHGNINDFKLFFNSHPGNSWTTSYGNIRYMGWLIQNGVRVSTQYNTSTYTNLILGEDVRLTLSPVALNRLILDGKTIAPKELQFDWLSTAVGAERALSADIDVTSSGANYFRYAKRIYMAAPVREVEADVVNYGIDLYDVTDGIDAAIAIGKTERVAIGAATDAVPFMAGAGVVDNADIDLSLIVGSHILKFTTKGQPEVPSPARIFAYGLKSQVVGDDYKFDFTLNEDAESVDLILVDSQTGAEVAVIPLGALNKGENSKLIAKADLPIGESETCNWQVKASAGNVLRLTKISDDEAVYKYFAPKAVAIDNTPESDHFGNVYVTNTAAGDVDTKSTAVGIYVLKPNNSDVPEYPAFSAGGVSWTGVNGEGPRKAAVAADGRVFIADASLTNAGIFVMDPATLIAKPMFEGATNTNGGLRIGGTYVGGQFTAVGVRGAGADLELYGVDKTVSELTWKKFVNVYKIGQNNTWTVAPTSSTAASSYFGNDNNSIVPVKSGYWGAQYRGTAGHNSANPALFYYNDSIQNVTFNSSNLPNIPEITSTSSQNGALAVNEKDAIVAISNNNGALVLGYTMKEGVPTMSVKFWHDLDEVAAATYDDFAFDYAGNLYAVSNAGKFVSVWSMPTTNNSSVVPAKKSMLISKAGSSIEEAVSAGDVKVYPTLIDNGATIELADGIESVIVFDATGALKWKAVNVGQSTLDVDFSGMSSGVYFIKVNGGQTVKVIKK